MLPAGAVGIFFPNAEEAVMKTLSALLPFFKHTVDSENEPMLLDTDLHVRENSGSDVNHPCHTHPPCGSASATDANIDDAAHYLGGVFSLEMAITHYCDITTPLSNDVILSLIASVKDSSKIRLLKEVAASSRTWTLSEFLQQYPRCSPSAKELIMWYVKA